MKIPSIRPLLSFKPYMPLKSIEKRINNSVRISDDLDDRLYSYINGIKSVIANYAEKNNIKVNFTKNVEDSGKFNVEVEKYKRECLPNSYPTMTLEGPQTQNLPETTKKDITITTALASDFSKNPDPLSVKIYNAITEALKFN